MHGTDHSTEPEVQLIPPAKYPMNGTNALRLVNTFMYHRPNADQPERYERIRDAAKQFAVVLYENCPQSRELSVALTELETSVMFANAAIARNEPQEDNH